MKNYTWALNQQKLARAVGLAGVKATEGEVKEIYVRIGGKLSNNIKIMEEIKEVEPVEETVVPVETNEPQNDTTNTETNQPVEETESVNAGQVSTDDVSLG